MTAPATTPTTSTAPTRTDDPSPAPLTLLRDPLADAMRVFDASLQLAQALHRSGFLPRSIKSPEQALAVILTGREMGIGPMQSIRSISIVDAKPIVAADLQLARFKAEGGRAQFAELTEKRAVLQLRHPNGDEHTETFAIEDARAAGLLGKDNWKKFPKAMLRSRVITAGLKSIGYEPMCGVYDPDEADHFRPMGAVPVAATAPAETVDAEIEDISDMEEDAPAPTRDLAWALAYPLPGRPTAWNGNGGKALGELPKSMIPGVRDWIGKKIEELGSEGDEAPPAYLELRQACDLILEARAKEPKEPPAAPATEPPTMDTLAREINERLKHAKLSPPERADFTKRAIDATDVDALQRLKAELDELIAAPV